MTLKRIELEIWNQRLCIWTGSAEYDKFKVNCRMRIYLYENMMPDLWQTIHECYPQTVIGMLENIVSLHLCCQSYHPFDYSFNFMEISRVIFGNFLFPRQIFYCLWWQNLRNCSWVLSVDCLNIHIFAVLQIWFIFYTWYKFCCNS